MAILKSLKNFFAPDAETSRNRRLDVFGTESKAVTGAVIIGGAAAAIAAPGVIAAGGLKKISTAIAGLSLKQQLIGAVAAPIVIGQVIAKPKRITQAPAAVLNFESNLYKLGKEPSLDTAKNIFIENPILSTVTAGAAAATLGLGIGGLASTIATNKNTKAIKEQTESIVSSVPYPVAAGITTVPQLAGSDIPLTPETQVIGREVKTTSVGYRRKKRKASPSRGNVSVRVLNQQTYISGR